MKISVKCINDHFMPWAYSVSKDNQIIMSGRHSSRDSAIHMAKIFARDYLLGEYNAEVTIKMVDESARSTTVVKFVESE